MSFPTEPFWVETHDWHTGGEPFRIVPVLPPWAVPQGSSVGAKRVSILSHRIAGTPHPLDTLRASLCHEPRGHADMYGGFIVAPDDVGADVGVLFWHKDGFSTACGHGTIALGMWAVANNLGHVAERVVNGQVTVTVDVPSGRVQARIRVDDQGKPIDATFVNVPSYPLAWRIPLHLPLLEHEIEVDLVWGGAIYAVASITSVGVELVPSQINQIIRLGREIKQALRNSATSQGSRHPVLRNLGPDDVYGVIFYSEDAKADVDVHQTNVVIFADGQVDRSPCGSGTAARISMLYAQGRLLPPGPEQNKLVHKSIVGSRFDAWVEEVLDSGATGATLASEPQPEPETQAVVPCVRGSAHLVGLMKFYIDPVQDKLAFVLR